MRSLGDHSVLEASRTERRERESLTPPSAAERLRRGWKGTLCAQPQADSVSGRGSPQNGVATE